MMGTTKTTRREAPEQETPEREAPETEAAVKTDAPERETPENPPACAGDAGLPAQVTALQGLNLRRGPARSYDVLEVLPVGGAVTLLPLPYGAEVPGWGLAVSESGTLGWVMTAFLAGPPEEA